MMTLICHLRTAWHYAKALPWVRCAEWTDDDAAQLAQFLRSPAGQKLRNHLADYVHRHQDRAVAAPPHLVAAEAAQVCGQKAILARIAALASPPETISDGETDADPGRV